VEDEEEEGEDVVVVLSSVSSILELEVRSGCNVCTCANHECMYLCTIYTTSSSSSS